MGFERAKIEIKSASVGTGFKVTLAKRGEAGKPAKMNFGLTVALAKTFGWSNGDKLEVLIGTGGDHGMMRFQKNNSIGDALVTFRSTAKGEWVSISLGHQSMFVDEAQPMAWISHEVLDDGYVEVVLPRWADKTAPAKTKHEPPPPRPIAPQASAKPRPAAVTASLMGDPPPNRREMLSKIGDIA